MNRRIRPAVAGVLTAACVLAAVPVPAADAAPAPAPASLPAPRAGVTLPAALDVVPRYQAAVSCDPTDRPGTVAFGRMVVATYGAGVVGYSRYCNGSVSEHHDGRAADWMLNAADPTQKAVAESFLAWLTADGGAMARRLGVQYVIWNRQMWRTYAPERGWTAYSGASPHTDHIHVSFTWDGAMGRTSWWTGRAVTDTDHGTCRVYAGQPAPLYSGRRTTPCPTALPASPKSTLPVVAIGSRDTAGVTRGQKALGIAADGVFGRGTQKAVVAYQRRNGLPTSGAFDTPTWNRLVPASATGAVSGPVSAPPQSTVARPPAATAPRTASRVPSSVVRPLAAHRKTVLRPGSRGPAVRSLQSALAVPVTGRMDGATVAAVTRVQTRWKLRATGTVDLKTWNRVELTRRPWLGHTGTTLRTGSTGAAVVALQRALGVGADGAFGSQTARAVRTLQGRYGLRATGVVDGATWRAVSHAAR